MLIKNLINDIPFKTPVFYELFAYSIINIITRNIDNALTKTVNSI